MVESFMEKRVIFPSGGQRRFLYRVKDILNFSWEEIANLLQISSRALTDWKREKFSMSYGALKLLSKKSKITKPHDIKIESPFWYVSKGARKGGLVVYKKYGHIGGDQEFRKKKWREWWEREGKYKNNLIANLSLPIKKPRKSKELAEFVGIILGDGGISQYQITITFHSKDEQEYSKFVIGLIKELFNTPISIYDKKLYQCFEVKISRINLVRFLVGNLGLKIGSKVKHQIDIPDWIKNDKRYSIACVRGLIDTDGCVVNHRYKSNEKYYSYKKISFTSHSEPLRKSVFRILAEIRLNPRLAKRSDIWIDGQEYVKKYFEIVGFHNQKHLKRYKN